MTAVDELLPVSITMTPEGVAESWLLRELGLTSSQVYALHGDVIGSPRHYTYCRHGRHGSAPGYFYTEAGVLALAEHFGRRVDIHQSAPPTPPAPMWWQRDDA